MTPPFSDKPVDHVGRARDRLKVIAELFLGEIDLDASPGLREGVAYILGDVAEELTAAIEKLEPEVVDTDHGQAGKSVHTPTVRP